MMNTGIRTRLRQVARDVLGHRLLLEQELFSVYKFMFDPAQLRFLMDRVQESSSVPGSFLEVGCAQGATTAFINKWLRCLGEDRTYIAIDTFSGFPEEQADYEVQQRGKPARIKNAFRENKREWVAKSLSLAGIQDVQLVQADAAKFDYATVGPIAFCLLDVDLYLPIAAALPHIYENLSPGGVIVIDDCMKDPRWDGALQAYEEFVQKMGMVADIQCQKLGVVRKPKITG